MTEKLFKALKNSCLGFRAKLCSGCLLCALCVFYLDGKPLLRHFLERKGRKEDAKSAKELLGLALS